MELEGLVSNRGAAGSSRSTVCDLFCGVGGEGSSFLVYFFPIFAALREGPTSHPHFRVQFLLSLLVGSRTGMLGFKMCYRDTVLVLELLTYLGGSGRRVRPSGAIRASPLAR